MRGAAGALLCLLLAAFPLAAQSVELGVVSRGNGLAADLTFRWDKVRELVDGLRDGLESRITFTFRVYERRSGLLPFLRDPLLAEKTVARNAFWDFLDNTFVVESDTGVRAEHPQAEDLLRDYLSLSSVPLYRFTGGRRPACYVVARAQFEPVRLVPPLTIVSLAGAASTLTTPWVRAEVAP